VLYGVQDVDPVARETARCYGLGAWAQIRYVTWPTTLPYLMTGIRLAAAVALILAITSEVAIDTQGLGKEISDTESGGAVAIMYAYVIVAGINPKGNIQAVLADGTGHGLAAALSVIPVVQVFYGMKDKSLTIDVMAKEMNSHIRKVMPVGRFVAATLISMDEQVGTISVWNGGIPFVIFIGENGEVLHQWKSNHPFLGLMNETQFDSGLETYHCFQNGYLFACSDGLLEAEDESGNALEEARLLSWLREDKEDKVKFVSDKLISHLGNKSAHDDVSFLIAPFTFGGVSEKYQQ